MWKNIKIFFYPNKIPRGFLLPVRPKHPREAAECCSDTDRKGLRAKPQFRFITVNLSYTLLNNSPLIKHVMDNWDRQVDFYFYLNIMSWNDEMCVCWMCFSKNWKQCGHITCYTINKAKVDFGFFFFIYWKIIIPDMVHSAHYLCV